MISYFPGTWTTTITYADYRSPRDVVRNPLYNRLKKKANQVRRCAGTGPSLCGIIVCDGGTNLFQRAVGLGALSLERIAEHFLRRTQTIDFVAAISVKDSSFDMSSRKHPYSFNVDVFGMADDAPRGMLRSLLADGLHHLPKPIRTPVNARYHLTSQKMNGLASLQFRDCGSAQLSAGNIRLSARAVMDYLAGRLDRDQFLLRADAWTLSILKKWLDEGNLVDGIDLVKNANCDDDELVLHVRRSDPAVSPFHPPS